MKDLKAHVDLSTGKILGCKKGSWKWWHEKGHIVFNNDENKSLLTLFGKYAFNVSIFFIMVSFIKIYYLNVAIILYFFNVFVFLYEEWWCSKYADNHCPPKHL